MRPKAIVGGVLVAAALLTPAWLAGAPEPAAAAPPKGPFEPNWESIKQHYRVPRWFRDGKFGIFMHWGLYSVPAHASEWYPKHMYSNRGVIRWHAEKFGPQDKFGYKDFIPLFKCEKFDPDAWAALFRKAGATYVVPTAEHHDGWALWDSDLTRWCAGKMGPKRDLIGDLAQAVRKQGLKFGVSNHRMEHYSFMLPAPDLKTDLFDPASADFYGPPRRGFPDQKFLDDWVARNVELIDKYRVDMLWFDNGVNSRRLDPVKLKVAAYYYNRASEWGKEVSISTKDDAYLAGSIKDFERQGRAPKELTDYVWQVDDPVGAKFGYVEGMALTNAGSVVKRLVENVSKNGNLLLNISPKADGTIPEPQQQILLGVGQWLGVNGAAIYGTRPWTRFGEGGRGQQAFRFTTRGDTLYAIALGWPGARAVITSLAVGQGPAGKIERVTLLGHKGDLEFEQDGTGLKVKMPADKPCDHAYALQITGLKLK
jgi:alpha-L-fucosidase